jgi:DNA-binding NtrC family response regulator
MDKLKALVVDDEESVCEAVKAILEPEGFAVTTTTSSTHALNLVRENAYDLIVSDLKMPELDGMQLYEKVRELGNTSMFILITAYSSMGTAVDAVKKGMYEFLEKPFTPEELRLSIRQRLKLLQDRQTTGGTDNGRQGNDAPGR